VLPSLAAAALLRLLFAVAGQDDLERQILKAVGSRDAWGYEVVQFATAVRDRHPSGLPRTVIAAVGDARGRGDLRVYRLEPKEAPRLLSVTKLKDAPYSLEIGDIIPGGLREIAVSFAGWVPSLTLYESRGEQLREIANLGTYWDLLVLDVDQDGEPELLGSNCCGRSVCGTQVEAYLLRRGDDGLFDRDPAVYVDYFEFTPEDDQSSDQSLFIPHRQERPRGASYVLHLINGGTRFSPAGGSVLLDGTELFSFTDKERNLSRPLEIDLDRCHKLTARVTGPPGSVVFVLVEQRLPARSSR
jgi:hypothetical protein